jgi:hypothetical protein
LEAKWQDNFDGADIILVLEGLFTFKDILDRKIKVAQIIGKIYIDANIMKENLLKV